MQFKTLTYGSVKYSLFFVDRSIHQGLIQKSLVVPGGGGGGKV